MCLEEYRNVHLVSQSKCVWREGCWSKVVLIGGKETEGEVEKQEKRQEEGKESGNEGPNESDRNSEISTFKGEMKSFREQNKQKKE